VIPVRYELEFYISKADILQSQRLENIKSYIALTGWALHQRRNVFRVRYEVVFISQRKEILIAAAVSCVNTSNFEQH
jgi:hypothetical protein